MDFPSPLNFFFNFFTKLANENNWTLLCKNNKTMDNTSKPVLANWALKTFGAFLLLHFSFFCFHFFHFVFYRVDGALQKTKQKTGKREQKIAIKTVGNPIHKRE